jgi:predicted MFS family arabinose efflux permease
MPAADGTTAARARGVAALVVLAGVTSALHVGKMPAAIPLLQQSLGLTLLQAGFLLSLVQLAGMLLGLPVGLMADRLGARRVMLWGLVTLAAGSALGAFSPQVNFLLATRVLEGAGFLLAVLPAPALLRQQVLSPAVLSRALGWWGAYMPLGTATALLLGVPVMAQVGWRGAWVALAALSLLAAVALARGVPSAAPLANATAAQKPLWPRLVRTLSAPGPWLVALAFFVYSGQWMAVVGFLPTIYSQAGYTGAVVGALSALAAGINMTGNIGAGRALARQVRPGVLLSAGYVAMAVGAGLAFAAVGHPLVQYLGVLLFSAVGGLIPGTLFGMAVALAPDDGTVSTTVGWMQQFSSLGQFLGPPLVAWVAVQMGGWQFTWLVTGACSLCGLVLAWRLQTAWRGRQNAPR